MNSTANLSVYSVHLKYFFVKQIDTLEHANLLAIHVKRATLQPRDIQLLRKVRVETDWHIHDYEDAGDNANKDAPPVDIRFTW